MSMCVGATGRPEAERAAGPSKKSREAEVNQATAWRAPNDMAKKPFQESLSRILQQILANCK